jgi:fructose-specific phosphotransferase system component IIB
MSFKTEIEAIVGDIDSPDYTAEAGIYLVDGVKYITKYVMKDPHMAERLTSSSTLNNSTPTLAMNPVLQLHSVVRNDGTRNRKAMEIEVDDVADYTDANSIYYTSKLDPKWYISNDTLHVIPTPTASETATVRKISPDSSVAVTDSSVTNFPEELERGIVLYASKELLRKFINSKNATLVGLTLANASPPDAISLSTVAYVDAAAGDVNATAVGAVTVASINDANVATNVPSYSKPATTADYAAGSTGVDDWITDEDPEMAQVALEKQSQLLQNYQLDIQNELNEFNKDNVRYEAEVQEELTKHNTALQKALTQAQIDAADAQQESQQATQVSLANKAKDLQISLEARAKDMESLMANNTAKVQDYMARVESYGLQVNEDVQRYQAEVSEVSTDYQWYAQQYQIVQQDLVEFVSYYIMMPKMGEQDETSTDA